MEQPLNPGCSHTPNSFCYYCQNPYTELFGREWDIFIAGMLFGRAQALAETAQPIARLENDLEAARDTINKLRLSGWSGKNA